MVNFSDLVEVGRQVMPLSYSSRASSFASSRKSLNESLKRNSSGTNGTGVADAEGCATSDEGNLSSVLPAFHPLTIDERKELERLRIENVLLRKKSLENDLLRKKLLQVERELEQQKKDFDAQKDLQIFGGLSRFRASNVGVGKKIGHGSFGAVYHGTWRGVHCAIKFINQSVVDELYNESSIMDKIDHPNIVRLYGVVVDDDNDDALNNTRHSYKAWPDGLKPPCMLLEFMGFEIENKTCNNLIEYLQLSKAQRQRTEFWVNMCGMLQGAARGMAYLHSQGVIHRDLKGVNLLIDARGNLKIGDFGLAKFKRSSVVLGKEGNNHFQMKMHDGLTTGVGTYTHMAPELMESGQCNTTTDVFSFGIIISEVITASEAEAVIDETRTNDFGLDLEKLAQFESGEIQDQLIAKAGRCCALLPEERPNADQIVDQLQGIQLRHQMSKLKPLSSSSLTLPDNPEEIATVVSIEASRAIFEMADTDGDGFLSYEETKAFAIATDGYTLTQEDYDIICDICGVETGLTKENVEYFYSVLRMGNPEKDLEVMKAVW